MGMGYAGWSALILEEAEVNKLNPYHYGKLLEKMQELGLDLDGLAQAYRDIDSISTPESFGLTDDSAAELFHLLKDLIDAIEAEHGIRVYLGYHNHEDDGDRYDDIIGGYWEVDEADIYMLTPAGNALKELEISPRRLHAVNFG